MKTLADLAAARRRLEMAAVKAGVEREARALREGYATFVSPEAMQANDDRIFAEYMAERDQ